MTNRTVHHKNLAAERYIYRRLDIYLVKLKKYEQIRWWPYRVVR